MRRRLAEAMGSKTDDVRFFRAPGRVNLMGDHTDYHDGLVLPAAIDMESSVDVQAIGGPRVVVRSDGSPGLVDVAADGSDEPREVEPVWGRLVAGVVTVLAEMGRPPVGAVLSVASSVPTGAGLSSSAAVEVAIAQALCHVGDFAVAPVELARACQRAEERGSGVPSGVMDQMTSVMGVAGHALLIDCRTLKVLPVEIPDHVAIVVAHSGTSRRLGETPYADRRAHGEGVARRLGLRSLRDASFDDVADDPIARHVVTENARVAAAAIALAAGDLDAVGAAMAESHASLRDDFRCSTQELDRLVSDLVGAGAIGARLTGAGWGGCVVALAFRDAVERVRSIVGDRRSWICDAVDGARSR